MSEEILAKARKARSPDELLRIAHESGQTVVTCDKKCHNGNFKASYYYAGGKMYFYEELPDMGLRKMWATLTAGNSKPEYLNKCGACKYLTFKNAVGCCGAE